MFVGDRQLVGVAPRERRERALQRGHLREDVLHPHVVGGALGGPGVHVLVEVVPGRFDTGPSDALIR